MGTDSIFNRTVIILKQLVTLVILILTSISITFADPKPVMPPSGASAPVADIKPDTDSYLLAPGDLLEISVWKEESMQKEQILVAPDGNITFPLVGTIMAAGKSISALELALAAKLADYIADPVVNVKLFQNFGNTIFVIGKVTKPGQYPVNRRIDVMQALSLAGGLTPFANTSSIFNDIFGDGGTIHVIRRVGNTVKVFPFDYDDVLNGENMGQNILLEPGDTVSVP
jgi:polysaccharide biosynthesis/export protein